MWSACDHAAPLVTIVVTTFCTSACVIFAIGIGKSAVAYFRSRYAYAASVAAPVAPRSSVIHRSSQSPNVSAVRGRNCPALRSLRRSSSAAVASAIVPSIRFCLRTCLPRAPGSETRTSYFATRCTLPSAPVTSRLEPGTSWMVPSPFRARVRVACLALTLGTRSRSAMSSPKGFSTTASYT